MANQYNLFISHSWAYSTYYDSLVNLLTNRPYFSFRNYSVPKNDPIHNAGTDRELSEAIMRQMSPCHVVIILGGVYASYSKWIQKEIKIAKNSFQNAKPILAVRPQAQVRLSSVVQQNADYIAGWNSDSIVKAIRELA